MNPQLCCSPGASGSSSNVSRSAPITNTPRGPRTSHPGRRCRSSWPRIKINAPHLYVLHDSRGVEGIGLSPISDNRYLWLAALAIRFSAAKSTPTSTPTTSKEIRMQKRICRDFSGEKPAVAESWACHHFDGVRSGKRNEIFVITTTSKALAAQTKAADQEINDQNSCWQHRPCQNGKLKFNFGH